MAFTTVIIILSGFKVHGCISPKDNQSSHNYRAPSLITIFWAAFAGRKKLIYSVNNHSNFSGLLMKWIHPYREYFTLPGSCPQCVPEVFV